MLLIRKDLGQESGLNTIKPIQSKLAAIHNIPSQNTKIERLRFIGLMNFFSKFIERLHVNMMVSLTS